MQCCQIIRKRATDFNNRDNTFVIGVKKLMQCYQIAQNCILYFKMQS